MNEQGLDRVRRRFLGAAAAASAGGAGTLAAAPTTSKAPAAASVRSLVLSGRVLGEGGQGLRARQVELRLAPGVAPIAAISDGDGRFLLTAAGEGGVRASAAVPMQVRVHGARRGRWQTVLPMASVDAAGTLLGAFESRAV